MWRIGVLSAQFGQRICDLFALYARPLRSQEPVVCVDEKSQRLLRDTRAPLPVQPGAPAKHDCEYARAGTCNLFVAAQPKGGRRTVEVAAHRAKIDLVAFIWHLLERVYPGARRIDLVLDDLNAHFRVCFGDVLGRNAARQLLRRAIFHCTPRQASWLNMAEIEIGILDRQCRDRRLPTQRLLAAEVAAWAQRRNAEGGRIAWTFTRQDADRTMGKHCVSQSTGRNAR